MDEIIKCDNNSSIIQVMIKSFINTRLEPFKKYVFDSHNESLFSKNDILAYKFFTKEDHRYLTIQEFDKKTITSNDDNIDSLTEISICGTSIFTVIVSSPGTELIYVISFECKLEDELIQL